MAQVPGGQGIYCYTNSKQFRTSARRTDTPNRGGIRSASAVEHVSVGAPIKCHEQRYSYDGRGEFWRGKINMRVCKTICCSTGVHMGEKRQALASYVDIRGCWRVS